MPRRTSQQPRATADVTVHLAESTRKALEALNGDLQAVREMVARGYVPEGVFCVRG